MVVSTFCMLLFWRGVCTLQVFFLHYGVAASRIHARVVPFRDEHMYEIEGIAVKNYVAFSVLSMALLSSCQSTGSNTVTVPIPDSLEPEMVIQRIERSMDDPSTRVNWRSRQEGIIPWHYLRTEGNTVYVSGTDGRSTYHISVTVDIDRLAIDGTRCPKNYREKFISRIQADLG